MRYWRTCQHAKLPISIVVMLLVWGMRGTILLDLLLHLVAMIMVAVKWIWLKCVAIGILLQLSQILVEHGIVIKATQVQSAGLGGQRMVLVALVMAEVRMRMLLGMWRVVSVRLMWDALTGLRLQRTVLRMRVRVHWELLVQDGLRVHGLTYMR